MTRPTLSDLAQFMNLPAESECVEFKEAKNSFDLDDLGKYFSALSNEAKLKRELAGWLIFGVTNKRPRQIVGTQFKRDRAALDGLKQFVASHCNNGMTFEEIHELITGTDERVLLFEIPPAIPGIPTTWKGHQYGRHGESLSALSNHEYEKIRAARFQTEDWSKQIVPAASINDLNQPALAFARHQYIEKHQSLASEIVEWSDERFLNKARVCISGKITRAALLLLGKPESAHFLSPAQAQISWILKDDRNQEKDYAHFDPPFILATDRILAKIRNLTIRQLPSGTLFPHELTQYDPQVLREAIHNCIAHQDYGQGGKITVVETPDSLLLTNLGSFIPGTVENMIRSDSPPEIYRNAFLAHSMEALNMIDTIGSGIKRMFTRQKHRSFPMPDYDLGPNRVAVSLYGRVIDENYTRLLMSQTDLDLIEVIALDLVQKKRPIDQQTTTLLKARGLIEGRRPNLFVSAQIAAITGRKAAYIKNRAFNKQHYKDLIIKFLEKFESASRSDFNELLCSKLSDALSESQKKTYITNLLQEMKSERLISPDGATRWARWRIHIPASNASGSS